jgi:PST family polysaccharide transporter
LSFKYFGIIGLGVTSIIMAVIHISLMQFIMFKLYKILFKKELLIMLLITIGFCLIAFFTKDFTNVFLRYGIGSIIFIMSLSYSILNVKKIMNVDVIQIFKNKFSIK